MAIRLAVDGSRLPPNTHSTRFMRLGDAKSDLLSGLILEGGTAAQNDSASRQDAGLHQADGTGAGHSGGRGLLLELANLFSFTSVFGGVSPLPHTHGRPGSRPASSFSACRPNGCGGRMAEVMSFAIRSSGSHDMRVRRLPGRKCGLGRLLHAPRATSDGEVHIAPREADCLLCAVEGKSGLDIAITLCTSRSTG